MDDVRYRELGWPILDVMKSSTDFDCYTTEVAPPVEDAIVVARNRFDVSGIRRPDVARIVANGNARAARRVHVDMFHQRYSGGAESC